MSHEQRDHRHAGDPQGLRHRQGEGRSAQGHRPRRRRGRVRRHRRAVRLRQVDAHEPHRLPRHARPTAPTGWAARTSPASRATSSPTIRNRRVGFVFQSFNLLPQITAFENVEMPLLFGGVAPKKRRERVEELLDARRPRRPHGAQAHGALGRPDAARRHRPRPGHGSRRRARRRADRQPRHLLRRRHHGALHRALEAGLARWSSSRTTWRSPAGRAASSRSATAGSSGMAKRRPRGRGDLPGLLALAKLREPGAS